MEQRLTLKIRTLSFDETGSGTRQELCLPARFLEDGGTCRLSYTQTEQDGARTETVICFEKGDPCVVTMEQAGARGCFMRFAPGARHAGEYRVTGLPTFPFSLSVRAVENTLGAGGGRLLLDYEMDFGGARTRLRLSLTATPDGEVR